MDTLQMNTMRKKKLATVVSSRKNINTTIREPKIDNHTCRKITEKVQSKQVQWQNFNILQKLSKNLF